MGTKERRTRERLETREMILEAAREMFAEEGYEAVTMRAIAQRIEYTSTAIYHHFPSKQALLTELCERDFSSLARHFQQSVPLADPIERLRLFGVAYVQFAEEYPSQYRFMFMTVIPEVAHDPAYVEQTINNPERNAYLTLRAACAEAIEQGRFRPEIRDPDEVAQLLWGTLHGLISLRVAKKHEKYVPWLGLRESAKHASDILLRGLLREPQA